MKFSVLMTTYKGEKPEYLDASLRSILIEQTRVPDQVVLVLDGPVSAELEDVISTYENNFADICEVVRCPVNQGQSKASAIGMGYVKYEYVARMDSDDISVPDRFEKELAIMEKNPQISVVGGWISEFEKNPADSDSLRVVPQKHEDITKMFHRRTPINNVTAMMKKTAIEGAGGYGRNTVNEDYSLYARMWVNGCQFYNLQEVMVHVRVGNGMVSRRGDIRIFKDWCKDQKFLWKNHKQSWLTSIISCIQCYTFVMMPPGMKTYIYKKFLRRNGAR